jgi:hypothetical protein
MAVAVTETDIRMLSNTANKRASNKVFSKHSNKVQRLADGTIVSYMGSETFSPGAGNYYHAKNVIVPSTRIDLLTASLDRQKPVIDSFHLRFSVKSASLFKITPVLCTTDEGVAWSAQTGSAPILVNSIMESGWDGQFKAIILPEIYSERFGVETATSDTIHRAVGSIDMTTFAKMYCQLNNENEWSGDDSPNLALIFIVQFYSADNSATLFYDEKFIWHAEGF